MIRIPFPARPLLAALAAFSLASCSLTPPERYNEQGQRVQRVCDEQQAATGSRVNPRTCRDVVVAEAEDADAAGRTGNSKPR
jgi:hypothetical protein